MSSRNVMTGLRGGGSLPASSGGASQPSRTGKPAHLPERAAARLWRYDFRHDAIAVRDQDGFATNGEADIFAKLVFENLQTD